MTVFEGNETKSQANRLAIDWLRNGVIALSIAGIYSVVLVILRTPFLNKLISDSEIFKSALIIHVNLSVLVWLMCVVAAIWSLNTAHFKFGKLCAKLSLVSTLIIGISPFFGQSPVMNNYIPMLENIVFIIGLSLFGITMLLFALSTLLNIPSLNEFLNCNQKILIQAGAISSAIIFIAVWICFALSYKELQNIIKIVPIDIEFYYELFYWSGGHLLQFLYTQILMIVWIILFSSWMTREIKFNKLYLTLLIVNFFASLGALLGHYFYDIISAEFKEYYTSHMQYMGGITPVLALIILTYEASRAFKSTTQSFVKVSIICSGLLFLSGGLIGILISGINVTIPAHYHGSIVGISIAFMGFAYMYVFSKKLETNSNWGMKYAACQLYTITTGQILHIGGLAYAGGYGVLRKTTNMEIALKAKVALGLMGGGGLIAIIGGLMFVVICGRNLAFNNR